MYVNLTSGTLCHDVPDVIIYENTLVVLFAKNYHSSHLSFLIHVVINVKHCKLNIQYTGTLQCSRLIRILCLNNCNLNETFVACDVCVY